VHGQPAPEGPRSDLRTDDRSYADELWRREPPPAANADTVGSDGESPSSEVDGLATRAFNAAQL